MSILHEKVMDVADGLHTFAEKVERLGKIPKEYTARDLACDIRAYANRLMDAQYREKLDAHRQFLDEEAHDEGELADWYIASVSKDDPPVWTEKHLKELVGDYWLIPRPMDERFKKAGRKNVRTKKKAIQRAEIVELMRRVCTAMTVAGWRRAQNPRRPHRRGCANCMAQ